ncbi:hypothetical protein C7M71_017575 [Peterkaempfera bronchialis]|uniref:Uncharacterized protein n=1 Tax=Peterkaempfera bronchialis TaxID=2126346 RepID=A0A345SYZ8_9ACTN|nr:hypothetical protein C7M71_017575 [Peterkaempfera bronchialis]
MARRGRQGEASEEKGAMAMAGWMRPGRGAGSPGGRSGVRLPSERQGWTVLHDRALPGGG